MIAPPIWCTVVSTGAGWGGEAKKRKRKKRREIEPKNEGSSPLAPCANDTLSKHHELLCAPFLEGQGRASAPPRGSETRERGPSLAPCALRVRLGGRHSGSATSCFCADPCTHSVQDLNRLTCLRHFWNHGIWQFYFLVDNASCCVRARSPPIEPGGVGIYNVCVEEHHVDISEVGVRCEASTANTKDDPAKSCQITPNTLILGPTSRSHVRLLVRRSPCSTACTVVAGGIFKSQRYASLYTAHARMRCPWPRFRRHLDLGNLGHKLGFCLDAHFGMSQGSLSFVEVCLFVVFCACPVSISDRTMNRVLYKGLRCSPSPLHVFRSIVLFHFVTFLLRIDAFPLLP